MSHTKDKKIISEVRRQQPYIFGQVARFFRFVGNLVVEHREVQREAEVDRVSGRQFLLAELEGLVVGFLRVTDGTLAQEKKVNSDLDS